MNSILLVSSEGTEVTFFELVQYLDSLNSTFELIDIQLYFAIESDKEHLQRLIFIVAHEIIKYVKTLKGCLSICKRTKIITPYQMRWSLINKFHARHYSIPVEMPKKWIICKPPVIDAYLLPCLYSNDEFKEDEAIKNCPTIIICFPNGGFIEYFYFQCEWVNFYLEKGINVLVWNYRGYYNSTGTPNPNNIHRDVEKVYDYLVHTIKTNGIIGVHGESLGGYAASHLARVKNIKFLLIDRSFWWLHKVISNHYGNWPSNCLKLLSGYEIRNDLNYIEAKCIKFIAEDSKDSVVPILSGMK